MNKNKKKNNHSQSHKLLYLTLSFPPFTVKVLEKELYTHPVSSSFSPLTPWTIWSSFCFNPLPDSLSLRSPCYQIHWMFSVLTFLVLLASFKPRHSSWPTVSLASVTTSSCGLPPTPSLDHIFFFTSPGNPAFNGSDITIICSLRAIKLSFVTMFTVNFYICLCALPTCKLRKGSKHASFSHHHIHGTWLKAWCLNNCLSSEWRTK